MQLFLAATASVVAVGIRVHYFDLIPHLFTYAIVFISFIIIIFIL